MGWKLRRDCIKHWLFVCLGNGQFDRRDQAGASVDYDNGRWLCDL